MRSFCIVVDEAIDNKRSQCVSGVLRDAYRLLEKLDDDDSHYDNYIPVVGRLRPAYGASIQAITVYLGNCCFMSRFVTSRADLAYYTQRPVVYMQLCTRYAAIRYVHVRSCATSAE